MSEHLDIQVEVIEGLGSEIISSKKGDLFVNNCNVYINNFTNKEIVDLLSKTTFTNVIINGEQL